MQGNKLVQLAPRRFSDGDIPDAPNNHLGDNSIALSGAMASAHTFTGLHEQATSGQETWNKACQLEK